MSTIDNPEAFIRHESVDRNTGRVSWLVDANTPSAVSDTIIAFWSKIISNESDKRFLELSPIMALSKFFGRKEAPDELTVVAPTRDSGNSPLHQMHEDCRKSDLATRGLLGVIIPTLSTEVDVDTPKIVSVGLGTWGSLGRVRAFDGSSTGFEIFRAVRTEVPSNFSRPAGANLSEELWRLIRSGGTTTIPPHG